MINLKETIKAKKIKQIHYQQQKFTDNEKRIIKFAGIDIKDIAKIEFEDFKAKMNFGANFTKEKVLELPDLLDNIYEKDKGMIYVKEENNEIIKFILVINGYGLESNQYQITTVLYKKGK